MSSPVADFELTVAGFARLFGGQLDDEVRSVLRDGVGDAADGDWAAVFAYAHYPDGTVEKVTIFTSEAGYAQRLAGAAGGRIPLPLATVQQRFPRVHPGWVIDNGDLPPAGTARVARVARGAGEGGDGSEGTVARAATHLSPGAPAQGEAQVPPEHAGSSRPAPGRPRRRAAARHRLGRQ
jgi:hypothetical protein